MFLRVVLAQLFILQHIAFTMPPMGLGIIEYLDIRKYSDNEHTQPPSQETKLLSLTPDGGKPGNDSYGGLEIGAENGTTYPDVVVHRQEVEIGVVPLLRTYSVTTVLMYMLGVLAACWFFCISCNILKRALSLDCTNTVLGVVQRRPSPPRVWFFKRGNEPPAEQELQMEFREEEN